MKACAFSKRATVGLMATLCAVALLATPAVALVRGGLSGQWQDWGDSVWEYYYFAPTNSEYWRFKSNHEIRFAYKCGPGQWWQYTASHGGFFAIGQGGVSNDFLGDDSYDHVVDTEWSFTYRRSQDCAYWIDTSDHETRFAYKYGSGQWWDYTTQWGHLGVGALATAAFIGDGNWHLFDTSNMSGGNYLGYTADAYFRYHDGDFYHGGGYFWYCAGNERYRFVYEAGYTGSWYSLSAGNWVNMTYAGYWENPDVRYHGGGIFIDSGLAWDHGTYRPPDVPSPRNIEYRAWYIGDGYWTNVTSWTINNPGSDNKWSGGDLNVLWSDSSLEYLGLAEYTNPDVVVFIMAMDAIGFGSMVDWMTLVRDYFRKNIRGTTVGADGNSIGWYMGQWMDIYNYTAFVNDWVRWGTLMAQDAQIVLLAPYIGQATTMLNFIAAWSGCDIFANTNDTAVVWTWYVTGSGAPPYYEVWNYNEWNVTWHDVGGTGTFFEYTSTGAQDYRWILYY